MGPFRTDRGTSPLRPNLGSFAPGGLSAVAFASLQEGASAAKPHTRKCKGKGRMAELLDRDDYDLGRFLDVSQPKNARWRGLIAFSALLCVLSFASSSMANPGSAPAQDPSITVAEQEIDWELVGLSALDAVVLRPLGALSTLGGFAIFLGSAPFVAPSGRLTTTWDIFVYGSYDYTFARPLGAI